MKAQNKLILHTYLIALFSIGSACKKSKVDQPAPQNIGLMFVLSGVNEKLFVHPEVCDPGFAYK